ncbi:MAG: zeta toxin family protein [Nitrospira sp.]|nr:zeta toxin family protein [Nitrospira sp.]MDH4302899.1 zeta toxin family protein [Nitrospira sp.]MDH5192506.1 zeta toxin family protein [Nitrospira sp.]
MSSARRPRIHVLAGVNGAGKSSIGGAAVRHHGGAYFNPDEAARSLQKIYPTLSQAEANSAAWNQGVRLLTRALTERLDFTFETTLGGSTIANLLLRAVKQGHEIHIWYVGLSGPDLHLERVRSRVSRGGHAIPERDIRRRYEHSRLNLIALLPFLTTLHMYDNSVDADPAAGRTPQLTLVLHMRLGKVLGPLDLASTPTWAKPIVAAALKLGHR